jgi:hypothetical protein
MRAAVSSAQEPMKQESRPRSEQGLVSAVNLARPLIAGSPRHPCFLLGFAVYGASREVSGRCSVLELVLGFSGTQLDPSF